jgi:hypothetical protein
MGREASAGRGEAEDRIFCEIKIKFGIYCSENAPVSVR